MTSTNKRPKLRLKGYADEWSEITLGEVAEFFKGSAISKGDLSSNGNPCVIYGELYTRYNEVITEVYSKTNKEGFLSKKGDILIPSSSTTKDDIARVCCLQVDNVVLAGDMNILRLSNQVNAIYISYYLKSKKNIIEVAAQGTTITHLYKKDLVQIPLCLPSLPEQQAIATLFTTLDNHVSVLQHQLKAYQDYKKSILQKLFPSKDSKRPQLRLKGFTDEWVETTLGEVAEKVNTKNTNNIYKQTLSNTAINGIVFQKELFDRELSNENNITSYYICEPNDFVYNPRISIHAPCGPISQNNLNAIGIVSPIYTVFKVTSQNVNNQFLMFFFNSQIWNKFILSKSNNGARHDRITIKDTDFFQMPIYLPSLPEQQDIATLFTDIDNHIANLSTKLNLYTKKKKALLQNIFPSI